MQELEGRPLRLSLAEQNPPPGSPPSPVREQQEETDSGAPDAGTEADSSSEPSEAEVGESNLQTAANY
jgi:nucleolin